MQSFNERDCHAKFNSQPCAQRYNSDDERNRSSSGSSSQRSLGPYADNYLVDVKFGVIVDVEATRTNLLDQSRRPSCSRLGSHWDRCGVHYVEPIEGKTK
jgi:hypothetical protein